MFRTSGAVRAYLLDAASAITSPLAKTTWPEGSAMLARIRALPFMLECNPRGQAIAASLAGIEQTHPAPRLIPYIARPPLFETLDWRPVILPPDDPALEPFKRRSRRAPATSA